MASTNNYPLFNKGISENFLLRLSMYDPEWRRLFHVHGTGDRYIWHQGWKGYGLPQPRVPGARIAQSEFQPDFGKVYIMQLFALGDAVPQEDIDDDIYAVYKFAMATKGGLMANSFMNLWQYRTAGFFQSQGFASGSSVAGMSDGKSLFNTAHPIAASTLGITYANRPSVDADLSVATWQAACVALWTQKAPDNLTFLRNSAAKLCINPALSYVAWEIRQGKWKPYSADRTENRIKQEGVEIIEWPYFQKSGATGTNNAWFFLGQQHYLNFFMRQAPYSKTDYDFGTNSQLVAMHTRGDYGADSPLGTYGSVGK